MVCGALIDVFCGVSCCVFRLRRHWSAVRRLILPINQHRHIKLALGPSTPATTGNPQPRKTVTIVFEIRCIRRCITLPLEVDLRKSSKNGFSWSLTQRGRLCGPTEALSCCLRPQGSNHQACLQASAYIQRCQGADWPGAPDPARRTECWASIKVSDCEGFCCCCSCPCQGLQVGSRHEEPGAFGGKGGPDSEAASEKKHQKFSADLLESSVCVACWQFWPCVSCPVTSIQPSVFGAHTATLGPGLWAAWCRLRGRVCVGHTQRSRAASAQNSALGDTLAATAPHTTRPVGSESPVCCTVSSWAATVPCRCRAPPWQNRTLAESIGSRHIAPTHSAVPKGTSAAAAKVITVPTCSLLADGALPCALCLLVTPTGHLHWCWCGHCSVPRTLRCGTQGMVS